MLLSLWIYVKFGIKIFMKFALNDDLIYAPSEKAEITGSTREINLFAIRAGFVLPSYEWEDFVRIYVFYKICLGFPGATLI